MPFAAEMSVPWQFMKRFLLWKMEFMAAMMWRVESMSRSGWHVTGRYCTCQRMAGARIEGSSDCTTFKTNRKITGRSQFSM
jgi:hypothetical protein